MKIGVTMPHCDLGPDPGPLRAFAQAADDLGFRHLVMGDHVLGADLSVRPDWRPLRGNPPPYGIEDIFHEPFVTLGYLAAVTQRIVLGTGVLILPQRQAVLVAKQAAEIDVLSQGRMRLGIGIGWNELEYAALDMEFKTRGARCSEQIEVMQRLWSEGSVSFEGTWHRLEAVGIRPLPVQRPIPVWIGGDADPVLRRIARMGDGWLMPSRMDEAQIRERVAVLAGFAREAGRDPAAIGVEAMVRASGRGGVEAWIEAVRMLGRAGVTHVTFNTESDSYAGRLGTGPAAQAAPHGGIDDNIAMIRQFAEACRAEFDPGEMVLN